VKKFIVFLPVLFFLALNTAVAFAESGAALFKSIGCIACHTVDGYGGSIGPNLSNVGRNKSLSWLKVQIHNPSAHFPAGSSATINGKTYIAVMPSYSRLSKFKINAIAEYLKSLGGRKNISAIINSKRTKDNNERLNEEFNRRVDEMNNVINNTSPTTLDNISTLLNSTENYISFLHGIINESNNPALIRDARRNIAKVESDQDAWLSDRQRIIQWCNDSALRSGGMMNMQSYQNWDVTCKQSNMN